MKFIKKSEEPEWFKNWKKHHSKDKWDDFRGNKNRLKKTLLEEQGYICCYCQKRVELFSSHIEHLKPQSKHPNEIFNYKNLLASCYGELDNGSKPIFKHCGHAKDDEELPVSPRDIDCENYFVFDKLGEIFPNQSLEDIDIAFASKAIILLELNCRYLVRRRKILIDELGLDEFDYSKDELGKLIATFNIRDKEDRFEPFCSAIVYVLKAFISAE